MEDQNQNQDQQDQQNQNQNQPQDQLQFQLKRCPFCNEEVLSPCRTEAEADMVCLPRPLYI